MKDLVERLEAVSIAGNELFPYREFPADLSAVSVVIDVDRPWLAKVTEVLNTNAPANAKPWCCYVRTVIFYENPWRLQDREYAKHDTVETLLCGHDVLKINDELFDLYGGQVEHNGTHWVMTRTARRRRKDAALLRAKDAP